MWRFGLPGSAERVWVLPEGVPHDDPSLEAWDPAFAGSWLVHWEESPDARRTLEELGSEWFGRALSLDPDMALEPQTGEIIEEIRRGRLVVWGYRRAFVSFPARLPLQVDPRLPLPLPTPATTPTWKLISLAYVEYLAPAAESPLPRISWSYSDPDGQVVGARIDVLRGGAPPDDTPIGTLSLNLDQVTAGSIPWHGKISMSALFPSSFVSCEFSPYRLVMTMTGAGPAQTASTSFRVFVESVELLGGPRVYVQGQDVQVYNELFQVADDDEDDKAIRPLPSVSKAKVYLRSNVFGVEGGESESAAQSPVPFQAYASAWGDGPRIPLVVDVQFRDSTGGTRRAPRGWGRRKVILRWEEGPDGDVDAYLASLPHACGATLARYLDYERSESTPNGRNCHARRGGKRSTKALPCMFERSTHFRFDVLPTRPDHVTAEPLTGGIANGYAGAMLRLPRQAGDTIKVTALFDPVVIEGIETPSKYGVIAAFRRHTPVFEVWRRVDVARYYKKQPTLTDIDFSRLTAPYEQTFVEMRLSPKLGPHLLDTSAYEAAIRAAIDGSDYAFTDWEKLADFRTRELFHRDLKHGDGEDGIIGRSFEALNASIRHHLKYGGDDTEYTQEELNLHVWKTADPKLARIRHSNATNDEAYRLIRAALAKLLFPFDGLHYVQFKDACSFVPSTAAGVSVAYKREMAILSIFESTLSPTSRTLAHEAGHALFLPHRVNSPDEHATAEHGGDPGEHDMNDPGCLMGYSDIMSSVALDHFCARCMIRLRGWDQAAVPWDPNEI